MMRSSSQRPIAFAVAYIAGAVIVGPGIVVFGLSFTRGTGDYCDSIYDNDPSYALRDKEFEAAKSFYTIGAGLMLTLGVIVLAYLLARHKTINRGQLVASIIGTLVMMLGYLMILRFDAGGGC